MDRRSVQDEDPPCDHFQSNLIVGDDGAVVERCADCLAWRVHVGDAMSAWRGGDDVTE